MKKIKGKRTLRALGFTLVFALIISGIFAFMSAQDKEDNVFTFGNVKVNLHEDDWFDTVDGSHVLKEDNKRVKGTLEDYYRAVPSADATAYDADGNEIDKVFDDLNNDVTDLSQAVKVVVSRDGKNVTYILNIPVTGDPYVTEKNGISDFAENMAVGQTVSKTPWVDNVGKSNSWVYISVGIPTVSQSDSVITDENSDAFAGTEYKIKVACYAFQSADTTENLNTMWNEYMTDNNPFGAARSETRVPVFEIMDLNEDDWTAVYSVDSEDGYNYTVYAYNCLVSGVNNDAFTGQYSMFDSGIASGGSSEFSLISGKTTALFTRVMATGFTTSD